MDTQIQERAEGLTGRICNAMVESMDLISVYIGDRLGLYKALADKGAMSSHQLAKETGIAERYAREWLEQQAVTGILSVEESNAASDKRRYRMPPGHDVALAHPRGLFPNAAMARAVVGAAQSLPLVLECFKTGAGLAWSEFGSEITEAQAGFNRPWLNTQLGSELLPAIKDAHDILSSGNPRVADVGCGAGWASIAIAQAYPGAVVTGFDSDKTSIEMAQRNGAEYGVDERTVFVQADAAHLSSQEPFDLAIVVEAIHDMPRPVDSLAGIRRTLKKGGLLVVADELVPESFEAPGGFMDRLFYGASVLICLPAGLHGPDAVGTGAVMRPGTLKQYAAAAGFNDFQVLPVEHPSLRFYQMRA